MNESIRAYILINAYVSILVAVFASLRGKSVYKYYLLSFIFSALIVYSYLVVVTNKSKKQ